VDRHVPLHCFRKHCAGAGIHAQEILEKYVRHNIGNVGDLLTHIKILKSIPTVLEEIVRAYDSGSKTLDEFVADILELLDEIRRMRQVALTWIPEIRMMGEGDQLEVWQKDYIQEVNEYAGELWQMEKHLSEYLADIYVKERRKTTS